MKLQLEPNFSGPDNGDGGIRRVVEAQRLYLADFGIDVIDSNSGIKPDVVALHAGTHAPPDYQGPIVCHCHGLYWKDYEWPNWAARLNREVAENIRQAQVVTVPSNWVGNAVQRAFGVDTITTPHGIDVGDFELSTNEGYVLWNKARVDGVCNPDSLNKLAFMAPNVSFVSTFGQQSVNTTIIGKQTFSEAKTTLSKASVYLSTTRETFGIGTLEAMASGIPVLGWDFGGNSDIVLHEKTGYLAKPGDYDDLLKGLFYCIDNHDVLGSNARSYVQKQFNWHSIMEQYAQIYQKVKRHDDKVSVVIPCYNLGRYLRKAVESVVDQAAEVIIINDASTDDTDVISQQLMRDYPDRVWYGKQETNQHVAAARNMGIDHAIHGFILTLDADDSMAPGSVEVLRQALIQDRGTDIAYGAVQFLNEDGTPTNYGPNGVSTWPPEFEYKGLHTFPFSYCPTTSLFRKEVWERTGGYRSRYKGVEDADFWTRAISMGFRPKKVTEAITLVYVVRSDSLSHTEKRIDWTKWYPELGLVGPEGPVTIYAGADPKISIIIPLGSGHEHLVQNALDSVYMQDFHDWECIVVLDTNNCVKLPNWVISVKSEYMNAGPGAVRNTGIDMARGDLIYFLDADDYMINHTALSSMYKVHKQHGGYVYTDWIDDLGTLHKSTDTPCSDMLTQLPTPVNILFEKRHGVKFDTNMIGWEEWDFVLQLGALGVCGNRISHPMFKYNTGSGTVRKKAHEHRDELVSYFSDKWKAYLSGEKELACGACGQRGRTVTYYENGELDTTGQTLMEYTGGESVRTYRGPITGGTYRFGTPTHLVGYVDDRDVDAMLNIAGFHVYAVV